MDRYKTQESTRNVFVQIHSEYIPSTLGQAFSLDVAETIVVTYPIEKKRVQIVSIYYKYRDVANLKIDIVTFYTRWHICFLIRENV
jgi:hypothetical protein